MAENRTPSDSVDAVRRFNRFYTGIVGALDEGLLDTDYSLTEARVLFELGQHDRTEVAELRRTLELDAGYLSRVLATFESGGLAVRERSAADGRRQLVRLTEEGRATTAMLNARSAEEVATMLAPLTADQQRRLVQAMVTITDLLRGRAEPRSYVVRSPRPGDLGWVVHRHGVLYAQEYGWDETFEAVVARIVADYVEGRDPRRERAWIAEAGGEPVGSVFCMRKDDRTAQLRLLLVEPSARGLGIGKRLVDECLDFARGAGYTRITLWTNDVLSRARRIYQRAGFELVEEERHHSFGHDLVGQTWQRTLT